MRDAEIIARLIYAAWISPTPTDEDIADFRAAMDCYARAARREEASADEPEPCGDSCPITYPAPSPPAPEPDTETTDKLDGFEPVPLRAHDTHTHTAGAYDGGEPTPKFFAGYGAGEKREIHARLIAFVATHGLGARRRIAEASNGVLTLEEVQNMTDAKRVTLSKWQAAAAAMDRIEAEEAAE